MNHKLLIIYLLLLVGCANKVKESRDVDLSKVEISDLQGQPIDLNKYLGKTVFINFWATWCKPCLQEMPSIESVQSQLKNQNVIFLLASNEEVNQIESFIKKHNYAFQYVHLENMEELGIQALPTTYIFNSEGKLKFSETGSRQWDDAASLDLITKITNDHEK